MCKKILVSKTHVRDFKFKCPLHTWLLLETYSKKRIKNYSSYVITPRNLFNIFQNIKVRRTKKPQIISMHTNLNIQGRGIVFLRFSVFLRGVNLKVANHD